MRQDFRGHINTANVDINNEMLLLHRYEPLTLL